MVNNGKVTLRKVNPNISAIEIFGEVTGFAETGLIDALDTLKDQDVKKIILDFTNMEYINSKGIGLLITILIRAHREGQKIVAVGLKPHFTRIFELTRLDEVMPNYPSELEALSFLEKQSQLSEKKDDILQTYSKNFLYKQE
ncbi:MAG: STAS domain-containing protein [Anaerolineae bacterium]|nr:STAS domain-containing protein [Anaerolineae bacterium]